MQWSSHRLHAWAARPCLPLLGLLSLQQSMSILQAQAGVCKAATTVVGAPLTMLAWVLIQDKITKDHPAGQQGRVLC